MKIEIFFKLSSISRYVSYSECLESYFDFEISYLINLHIVNCFLMKIQLSNIDCAGLLTEIKIRHWWN
jgi:hypothetical protein